MQFVNSYFKPLEHLLDGSYCNYRDIKPIDIAIIATYATIVIPLGFFTIALLHSCTWASIESKASYTYLAQYILASHGNKDAQYQLGEYFYRDDEAKAAEYYKLAADQGHKRAQYDLAYMYYKAEMENQECKEALNANGYEIAKKYFLLSADEHGDAYYFLGKIAEKENKTDDALAFYRKCVDGKGHAGNYYYCRSAEILILEYKKLAQAHKDKGEKEKAFEYLKKAADLNDPIGRYYLAVCYETGYGVKSNITEALKLYANFSYEPAQKRLQEYIDWYKKAAEKGDAAAMYGLGLIKEFELYEYEAQELYKKAAEMGNKEAQYALGYSNYQDAQRFSDKAKYLTDAQFWFEKAAAQGYQPAIDALEIIKREENNG